MAASAGAHALALAVGLVVLTGARDGLAAPPEPPVAPAAAPAASAAGPSMTLDQAIAAGAWQGPAAIESSKNRAAAAAFARDPGSSLPSVPQATVLAGARNPYNLPVGPEVVLSVQQEISLRRLGTARRRAADWAAHAASSELERARLEGAATAALAWVDLLEAQGLVRLRTTAAEDAARLARIAEVRVTAGVATAVERSLARAEQGSAQLAILEAEGRATEARLVLAHATGTAMAAPLVAEGRLDSGTEPGVDERAALEGVAKSPAVRAAEARATHAVAEGSVVHATQGPTFALGASAWREGSGDHAAALVLTVPLPFFDPARYDVGRQSLITAAAQSHAARLRTELERETLLALHDREHTREVEAALRERVLVPVRGALDTAMTTYSAGTNDLGVVLLARRAALTAEERLVAAMADVRRADIRLAAVAGTLLQGRAAPAGGATR